MPVPANFNRPPRQPLPRLPIEEIDLPPPPAAPPNPGNNWLISVLPVMGIGVMALFYVWRALASGGSGNSALFAIPLFVLAVFAVAGTVLAGRWRQRDHERNQREARLEYIRTLERKRARLQAAHTAQRGILQLAFPDVRGGLDRALRRDTRLWERRPDDDDFMAVRVGVGEIPSPVPVSVPDPDSNRPELERALRLADTYRTIANAPVTLSMFAHPAAGVAGRRDLLLAAARAMVCGLALTHAPSELRVYLFAARSGAADWDWMRWLPHVRGGDRDTLAFDPAAARLLLGELSQALDVRREARRDNVPHLLVIVADLSLIESEAVYETLLQHGGALGASVLCLTNDYESVPGACTALLEIYNNSAFKLHMDGQTPLSGDAVDTLPAVDAAYIARALASVRVRETGVSGRVPSRVDFLDVHGLRRPDEVADVLRARWRRRVADGVLPFPVAIGQESLTTNTLLMLDEDHHGPHGVLAGTTGSGKSELLQTLVCGLALEHDPRFVSLLLIDFKGGSTFGAFARLPHTVGMVTNLDGSLVERALAALQAELKYRQQFLKQMGVRDITQFYRYHANTPDALDRDGVQPLPHLFIIVDEFAQLAKEMPDFLHELVKIAQVGRSLGLHLVLGTQSPMDVITDEMNANLQFRICLRVQNAEASRAMLRRPDAAYLPPGLAGRGYLMVGERGVYKQFQTAYAGGDDGPASAESNVPLLDLMTPAGQAVNLLADDDPPQERALSEPRTTATAVIDAIAAYVERENIPYMPPLLLPPLDEGLTLEAPFVQTDFGGWNGQTWTPTGYDERGRAVRVGSAPAGLVDDVYAREQVPLWVHLHADDTPDGRSGHLLVVGNPGSGKTTLLKTLALSLALLHPPGELHLYFLSFTGRGLDGLGYLPHAERVVHGTETERVRRLFGRLLKTLKARQTSRGWAAAPTIVLFCDQYEQLRDTFYDQHLPDFERLIHEGRSAGIYVVFTASTVSVVPDRTRALVQQRIALRLSNASDYLSAVGQVNTDLERELPPGRGFVAGSPPLMCQVSLPCFSVDVGGRVDDEMRQLINGMRQGYARMGQMQSPPPITELPAVVLPGALEGVPAGAHLQTPLGQVDDDALSDFVLDWTEQGPHFVVSGPPGSGKTNLLMLAVVSAAVHYSPEQVRFLLVDFGGRSLRALEPLKHVLARVTNAPEMETQLANLESELAAHAARPGGRAPKTVVIIDDYEIAADVMSMNLSFVRTLRDAARQHGEDGLHIWAAGYLERATDALIKQLLLRRTGFALREREALHNLNVRVAGLSADMMPVGRAYYAQQNTVQVVQTALVEDVAADVAHINGHVWPGAAPAAWAHPAGGRLPGAAGGGGDQTRAGRLDIDTAGLIEDLLDGED